MSKGARIILSAFNSKLVLPFTEGGKGGIDHVSWKIKWPFHTSRTINSAFHVSREKNIFIRSVFLTLVKNYSQGTALFDVLTIPPLLALFLVLWKGNRVLCLEVDARHHLLLIQNHCHQRSRHRIWSKTNGERVWIQSNFVAINRPEFVGNQRVYYFLLDLS